MAVVLPAPLRPRKPRTSPWTTSRLRSFKAVSDPYCFVRPRIEMAGVCASVVLTRSLRKSVAPSLCSRATQKESASPARHLDMARSFSSRWVRAHSPELLHRHRGADEEQAARLRVSDLLLLTVSILYHHRPLAALLATPTAAIEL